MYTVSFFPILLAGIVSVVIGVLWYGLLFGKVWARVANLTPEILEKNKRRRPYLAFAGLLIGMLIAYVMQDVGIALNIYDGAGAFVLGLWCWLGFVAPVFLSTILWEQKSIGYYFLHIGYWFVSFVAMAMVLFYMSQLFAPISA